MNYNCMRMNKKKINQLTNLLASVTKKNLIKDVSRAVRYILH